MNRTSYTFEQCAGFLRIQGGDEPLDASSVHPEAYPVVERIRAQCGREIRQFIGDASLLRALKPEQLTDERFGLPTVRDIIRELEKPGRDPRPEFRVARFSEGIEDLRDLKPGMILEGVVTNVAAFGAFVHVGAVGTVHQGPARGGQGRRYRQGQSDGGRPATRTHRAELPAERRARRGARAAWRTERTPARVARHAAWLSAS